MPYEFKWNQQTRQREYTLELQTSTNCKDVTPRDIFWVSLSSAAVILTIVAATNDSKDVKIGCGVPAGILLTIAAYKLLAEGIDWIKESRKNHEEHQPINEEATRSYHP